MENNMPKYVAQLQDQIVTLNEKLSAAEALKSHFISNITNEIVNPFASILGLSTQILESKEISVAQMKYLASLIHTETFHLDFQLRNIFAAAKIEAGEAVPELSYVDITEMLEDIVELFWLEAGKKNVKIEVANISSGEIRWLTDSVKLRLIIINFLHNAVKFANEDTIVVVHVEQSADSLTIAVEDKGIGISKKEMTDIFNRFSTKVAGINTAYRGNGLGLSVNKALVDVLDGAITVESEIGKGTKFITTLPLLADACISGEASEFLFDDELIF